jgi:hypothetical protein
MTPRRTPARVLFTLAAITMLAGGTGLAVGACSSSETDGGGGAAEAGTDASIDRKVVGDTSTPEEDAMPQETSSECIARCGKEHPNSVAKYNSVDTCWAASCMGPCVDQNGMFNQDAGDAGDGGGDAGDAGPKKVNDGGTDLCMSTYSSSVDRACDDCTEKFCCAEWDSCYTDMDCQDYNDCLADCP